METLIPKVDTESTRTLIRELKMQIDDRMQQLNEKIRRIRDDAAHYEQDAIDRAYAEVEPMRRQMEAMITTLANYESLRSPPPTIILESSDNR